MSATYDPLLSSTRDRVRALLGDTIVVPAESALHSDEHIAAVLLQEGSFEAGLLWLAEELVARFAQSPVKVSLASGTSVDFAQRIPAWQALAARMRKKLDDAARVKARAGAEVALSASVDTVAVWQ